jgi:hypothetical protein
MTWWAFYNFGTVHMYMGAHPNAEVHFRCKIDSKSLRGVFDTKEISSPEPILRLLILHTTTTLALYLVG